LNCFRTLRVITDLRSVFIYVVVAIAQLLLLPSQLKAQLNTSGTDVILSCTGPYSGREAVIPTPLLSVVVRIASLNPFSALKADFSR